MMDMDGLMYGFMYGFATQAQSKPAGMFELCFPFPLGSEARQKEGHKPSYNGCGSLGIKVNALISTTSQGHHLISTDISIIKF